MFIHSTYVILDIHVWLYIKVIKSNKYADISNNEPINPCPSPQHSIKLGTNIHKSGRFYVRCPKLCHQRAPPDDNASYDSHPFTHG